MEMSYRTLAIAGASVLAVGMSMRLLSGSLSAPSGRTETTARIHAKPIPNSDFSMVEQVRPLPDPAKSRAHRAGNRQSSRTKNGVILSGDSRAEDDQNDLDSQTTPTQGAEETSPPTQSSGTSDDNSD
jgi:hypothetical protein